MFNNLITDLTKKVQSNYFVKEKFESGIVLLSWEVKSIRLYGCSIVKSYAYFKNFEFWISGFYVNVPFFVSNLNLTEDRNKKLLLNKKQILHYNNLLKFKGFSIIPAKVYWKNNFIKVELFFCKGKKNIDKKNDIKYKYMYNEN